MFGWRVGILVEYRLQLSIPCQQTAFVLIFLTHVLVVQGNAPVLVDLPIITMHPTANWHQLWMMNVMERNLHTVDTVTWQVNYSFILLVPWVITLNTNIYRNAMWPKWKFSTSPLSTFPHFTRTKCGILGSIYQQYCIWFYLFSFCWTTNIREQHQHSLRFVGSICSWAWWRHSMV